MCIIYSHRQYRCLQLTGTLLDILFEAYSRQKCNMTADCNNVAETEPHHFPFWSRNPRRIKMYNFKFSTIEAIGVGAASFFLPGAGARSALN
jgi:hypothetical protein